jgi:RNA polymerase-binding transcription factor DksA
VADQKDAASRDAERWLIDTQTTQASMKLHEIGAALSRIRDGSYGRCIDCGDPIDLLRLTAMPEAARCAQCQGEHEHAAQREHRRVSPAG